MHIFFIECIFRTKSLSMHSYSCFWRYEKWQMGNYQPLSRTTDILLWLNQTLYQKSLCQHCHYSWVSHIDSLYVNKELKSKKWIGKGKGKGDQFYIKLTNRSLEVPRSLGDEAVLRRSLSAILLRVSSYHQRAPIPCAGYFRQPVGHTVLILEDNFEWRQC